MSLTRFGPAMRRRNSRFRRSGQRLAARVGAQPPPRSARIGWLTAQRPASLVPFVHAFRGSLAELGFVEGRNLTIDFRYGDDDASKVPALAEELVRLPVDLIVVQGEAVLEIKGDEPAGAGGLRLQRRSDRRRPGREPRTAEPRT